MFTEPSFATGVGFRHVVDDGVALLQKEELAPDRREYVLNDLIELLGEAHRGFKLIGQNSLFAGSQYKRELESFSLLSRYLQARYKGELPSRLEKTKHAFEHLRDNRSMSDEILSAAMEVMNELLSSMRREGVAGIRAYPEEILSAG